MNFYLVILLFVRYMRRTNGMFKNFQMARVSEKRKYTKIEQTLLGLLSNEWIYNNYFKWLKAHEIILP